VVPIGESTETLLSVFRNKIAVSVIDSADEGVIRG
jgi:hypothetical protein